MKKRFKVINVSFPEINLLGSLETDFFETFDEARLNIGFYSGFGIIDQDEMEVYVPVIKNGVFRVQATADGYMGNFIRANLDEKTRILEAASPGLRLKRMMLDGKRVSESFKENVKES